MELYFEIQNNKDILIKIINDNNIIINHYLKKIWQIKNIFKNYSKFSTDKNLENRKTILNKIFNEEILNDTNFHLKTIERKIEITDELKNKIKEKFSPYKDKYKKLTKLIQEDKEVSEFCYKTLKEIPEYQEIKYIVKCICNNVDLVRCKVCGKILTYYDSVKSKFKGLYCGKQCQYKDQAYLNYLDSIGVKKAFKEKTGKYINPFSLPEVKEKIKQTNLKKYGYENPAQAPEIIKKIQQTKRINGTNTCSKQTQQKMKQTSLEKYGVQYYAQTQQYKQRMKQKCQQTYGYDNYSQVPEIKEKVKKTCKIKYGSEYYLTSQDYKQKNFNTAMKKFNAKTYLASEQHRQNMLNIGWQTILSYNKYVIPLFTRQEYERKI